MFRKVCIPITNESLSIHAARAALDFAHKLNASVLFVSVFAMPIIYRSQSEEEVRLELQKNTEAFLETWIEFAEHRQVPCSTIAIEARASGIAQTIAETALQEHCDLIAMGTHAYEGLNRLLLGSVAEAKLEDISHKELVLEPAKGRRIAEVILEIAKAHHAELIILGTHGYSGFERILLGSVAQAVAHHAPVPVLLTRGVEREKIVSSQPLAVI